MPMYDFRCEKCGTVSEYFLKKLPKTIPCNVDSCLGVSYYFPSFWYSSEVFAQRFDPVVIHKDAEGNIRFPAHTNAPVPKGFHKVELTDINQVRKLEREINSQDRKKADRFREARSKFLDGQLKENRRAMETLVERFSQRGKRFYDMMRQVSEDRQKNGLRNTNPEFYVDAFSMDQSNRDSFYNEQGGSHRR